MPIALLNLVPQKESYKKKNPFCKTHDVIALPLNNAYSSETVPAVIVVYSFVILIVIKESVRRSLITMIFFNLSILPQI